VPALAAVGALVIISSSHPASGNAVPERSGVEPVTEQHAHIAGDPGSDEVDLALRVRRGRSGDRAGPADDQSEGVTYSFEQVVRAPGDQGPADPCAVAGGQLVNVFRQTIAAEGGPLTPIRTACLTQELVAITGDVAQVSAGQIAELLRHVTLPGGIIQAVPGDVGLAGLDTRFRLDGAVQPPVELTLGGAVLHAEFSVTGYRWSFGDGQPSVMRSPAQVRRNGEIRHVYERTGRYPVSVQVTWAARAYLGGNPIAGVDGLVSGADLVYTVHEVYGVLAR
jgi:hypothetical protein